MDYVDYTNPDYPWLEAVQIISVGMNWPASTGPYTATFEQLADIVRAANDDPLVLPPRVKLGHTSEVNGQLLTVNPFADLGDAAPAFGRFVNLRTTHQGAVLVGDMVEVPAWLADAMPSAYPSRSAEPWLAHTTPGGSTYAAVLTAVSLLGEYMPAIQDLDDLQRFMADGPQAVAAASTREASVPATATPELSMDAGVIADRFNFGWCFDPDNIFEDGDGNVRDPWMWWCISVRVDPQEIIVRGDGEDLWRLAYTTDGEDSVEFGDPERVREVYVPVNASGERLQLARTAPVRDGQRVLASTLDRPEKPAKPAASRPDTDNETQEVTMPTIDIAALRERTGLTDEQLPDDATMEQINEALAATPETPEVPEGETPDEEAPESEQAAEQVAASQVPDGMVLVPAGPWAEVQAGAQAGTRLSNEAEETRRDQTIQAALDVGKIAPAQRDSMVNLHAERPDAFYTLLTADVDKGGLAEGLVPVEARGRTSDVQASASESAQSYIDRHFPRASRRQRGVRHREEA